MNDKIKEKIAQIRSKLQNKAKNVVLGLTTTVMTMTPGQTGATTDASPLHSDKNITPTFTPASLVEQNIISENITMGIGELKSILEANPDLSLSVDALSGVQPGPSLAKTRSIVSKGFTFTTRNSRGEVKQGSCSLAQSPQGRCAAAVKRLLNKVHGVPVSNNLSAWQEKDYLLKSDKFVGIPIDIKEVKDCPLNTVVVIPKCQGHPHGHIMTVVDEGVYCSDGKETGGQNFENNYKDAKGVYAFLPVDGSIKMTPQMLEKNPELYAAVVNAQSGKNLELISGKKPGEPILFAENTKATTQQTATMLLAHNARHQNIN